MEAKTIQALEKAQLDHSVLNSLIEQNHHCKEAFWGKKWLSFRSLKYGTQMGKGRTGYIPKMYLNLTVLTLIDYQKSKLSEIQALI